MKRAITIALTIGCLLAAALEPGPSRLDFNTARQAVGKQFHIATHRIEWLLLDAQTGRLETTSFEDPSRPLPVGSLVKPFTALAYAQQNAYRYPNYTCLGSETNCWLPAGHGSIDMESAIAYSCNSYFLEISDTLQPPAIAAISAKYLLQPPGPSAGPRAYAGFGRQWPIAPLQLARAFTELQHRAGQPGVDPILRGMARAARHGTAAGAGRALGHSLGHPSAPTSALAKTGTAPCSHPSSGEHSQRASNGDGYALLLYPADRPRYTLLVQVHGLPGRLAASIAGAMMRASIVPAPAPPSQDRDNQQGNDTR